MPDLKLVNLIKDDKHKSFVKKLYKEAFPVSERMPFWALTRLAKKDRAQFFVICDADKPVGMTYTVLYRDIVYILYLAIDNKYRGGGYGSMTLGAVKKKYFHKRIILCVEELDPNSNNYEQRLRRLKFYEKNGFSDLGYTITEASVTLEMLGFSASGKTVSKNEYSQLMQAYFGNTVYKTIYKRLSDC